MKNSKVSFKAQQELLTKFSSLLSYKSCKSSQLANEKLNKLGIKLQCLLLSFVTPIIAYKNQSYIKRPTVVTNT